jgi:hypothetical protein
MRLPELLQHIERADAVTTIKRVQDAAIVEENSQEPHTVAMGASGAK